MKSFLEASGMAKRIGGPEAVRIMTAFAWHQSFTRLTHRLKWADNVDPKAPTPRRLLTPHAKREQFA